MAIEKIKTELQIQPIYLENGPNGLNWQCCLASSSKTAPQILIFSIAMIFTKYSFEVKNIEIFSSIIIHL